MTKPKLKVKPTFIDYFLESVSLSVLIAILFINVLIYSSLIDKIISHYNLYGMANSTANKWAIWIFSILGLISYAGFLILIRFPHLFNYPVKVTESNSELIYKRGVRVIRITKLLFLLLLFYFNLNAII